MKEILMGLLVGIFGASSFASENERVFRCSEKRTKYDNQHIIEITIGKNNRLTKVVRLVGWHDCSEAEVSRITFDRGRSYSIEYSDSSNCFVTRIELSKDNKTIIHSYNNDSISHDSPVHYFHELMKCVEKK